MTEENWWDPNAHSAGTFLDGKRGVISEATFERNNCRGKCPDRTVLKFRLTLPDVAEEKQPFPLEYPCGDKNWPSNDRKTKDVSGVHLFSPDGKKIDKKSIIHSFLTYLASAGFPMSKFADQGAEALNGADVTFVGKDFYWKIKGEDVTKGYDLVKEFHGFVDGDAAEAAPAVDEAELVADLQLALKDALTAQGGEIPRGQLSIRLGQYLKDNPNRPQILALVTKDEVLGGLEGITFDKKSVKLA